MSIWFLPGYLWRIILKSTLWFWWILLFIGGAPNIRDGVDGLRADQAKHLTRIFLVLGIISVLVFFAVNVFAPVVKNAVSSVPVLPVVAVLFLVDWKSIPVLPILSLFSGILALIIWGWADAIIKNDKEKIRAAENERGMAWLAHLIQWKAALFYALVALSAVYIGLYVTHTHHWITISDFWLHKLGLLYGPDHVRVFTLPAP